MATPPTQNFSTAMRYAFAFLTVIVASLLRAAFDPNLGSGVPFIVFYPAVVVSAWLGGLWPGILSTVLSAFIAWYVFIPPAYSFTVLDSTAPTQLTFFSLAGVLISFLAESLHRARRRAQEGETRERQEREQFRVTLDSI